MLPSADGNLDKAALSSFSISPNMAPLVLLRKILYYSYDFIPEKSNLIVIADISFMIFDIFMVFSSSLWKWEVEAFSKSFVRDLSNLALTLNFYRAFAK